MNFSPSWSVLETSMAVRRTATVEFDELLRGLCCCGLAVALPSNVADDVIFDEILWLLMTPNRFFGKFIPFFFLHFYFF